MFLNNPKEMYSVLKLISIDTHLKEGFFFASVDISFFTLNNNSRTHTYTKERDDILLTIWSDRPASNQPALHWIVIISKFNSWVISPKTNKGYSITYHF